MVNIKKIVLDVLKPHQPNSLEFCQTIAGVGPDYHVRLVVLEMDKNTETLQTSIQGSSIHFEEIKIAITEMGGSIHSIDEVEVQNEIEDES